MSLIHPLQQSPTRMTRAQGGGGLTAMSRYATTPQMPSAPQAPAAPNAPMFDDPAISRIETHATDQYNQATNPAAGSPDARLEEYLGKLATTLQAPAYSQSDESIYTGSALDALQREQDATKQRWAEEMSRRGIPLSSGPALEGLRQIEDHYSTMRTQTHADFAKKAIDDTRTQRMQAADVLGQLVNAGRQRQALASDYARVPYQLEQDAFARNASLVNGGGSPASYLNSAVQVANGSYNVQQNNQATQATNLAALFKYLAAQGYFE